MFKYLTSFIIALALTFCIPAAAFAASCGVVVGVTVGAYSASAQSGGALGNIIVGGQIGTFSQSAGSNAYASAGMASGVASGTTLTFAFDGINNGQIDLTRHSSATIQGFGTAGSTTTISYAGDGAKIGLGFHFAASRGNANSAGQFFGIGIIAAVEP